MKKYQAILDLCLTLWMQAKCQALSIRLYNICGRLDALTIEWYPR